MNKTQLHKLNDISFVVHSELFKKKHLYSLTDSYQNTVSIEVYGQVTAIANT